MSARVNPSEPRSLGTRRAVSHRHAGRPSAAGRRRRSLGLRGGLGLGGSRRAMPGGRGYWRRQPAESMLAGTEAMRVGRWRATARIAGQPSKARTEPRSPRTSSVCRKCVLLHTESKNQSGQPRIPRRFAGQPAREEQTEGSPTEPSRSSDSKISDD